ncbi:FG-GAP-like repeat-containing protein [Thiocapsa bogorovii]|uniref:FG-GAP-like repeat-containing protein n=1 Tax=Thiocapsa bogorovii TaxID=521689 RepID=UPI001E35CF66|nr:FG-GAP-like repeat-containing protein [Thiocapsa bogorovii]UHD17113.1 FG-GAP-like repeat-containing protein [Thiocapsa bogorovii]
MQSDTIFAPSRSLAKKAVLTAGFLVATWLIPGTAISDAGLLNIADSVGIAETSRSYGVSVEDYDGDGLADFLYNRAWMQEMRLYRNLGGRFSQDRKTNFGLADRLDCQWGDPNQDGLPDLYCIVGANFGTATKANQLWIQQQDGTFLDQASQWRVTDPYGRGRRVAWFNYNGDEFPDLFVGNDFPRKDGIPSPNRVFVNQGGRRFTEAVISGLTQELGAWCALAVDIDRDGYDDLFVCGSKRLYVYRNLGGNGFEDVAPALNLAKYYNHVDAADLNGNGYLDLILVGNGRACIRPGTGFWSFGPQQCYGTEVKRTVTVDTDGNGILDIYVGRGGQSPNLPDLLLRNNGGGQFTAVQVGASTAEGTGNRVRLAALDHDNDGREGVLVVNATDGIAGPLEFMNLDGQTNRPPVARNDSAGITQGGVAVVDVLANDTDPNGDATIDPMSLRIVTPPRAGVATANENGSVTYRHNGATATADSFTYTVADTAGAVSNVATVSFAITPGGQSLIHHGTVSGVGDIWQTVTLPRTFTNPVVIASVQYDAPPALPVVARVRNAAANRFEVRVQNPSGTLLTEPYTLHYLVVEAGVYTRATHGITMEAVRATSTQTSRRGNWSAGNARNYAQPYTKPVVLGQIMSENDPRWSVFWARGGSPKQVPTASSLVIGKHVGEDSVNTRANELVGYLVIEAGSGTVGSLAYQAGVSTARVGGVDNAPPFLVPAALASPTATALISAAAMQGGDGGWPVLYGNNPLANAALHLAFDEDQIRDPERIHIGEAIAYIILN